MFVGLLLLIIKILLKIWKLIKNGKKYKYDNIYYIGEVSSWIAKTIGLIKSISIYKFVYLNGSFFYLFLLI